MTSTSKGITVARLSHVGLRANDLSKQAEFYTERWGLEPIDEDSQDMFLRADGPDHHVLTLHTGSEPAGLDHFAFEVAHPDDLDRAADVLSSLGHEIVAPPTQELEPGIARAIRFKDPHGNIVELVAGVDQVRDDYGARDVKPTVLNHVVLNTANRPALEQFYGDLLGFKLSDTLPNFMTFWRCNANHHSLAFASPPGGQLGLNHAAFEVRDWNELMRGVFFLGEHGVKRMWGPGRHLAGNNLFSYYFDPEGNVVEYTCEVEQITNDDYVPPIRPMVPDQWGSLPPGR
ncbi:MAG: VOC family protein [Chloroflexi bacterium]|nr:VOC family protein [Chloroflexota bacterium]